MKSWTSSIICVLAGMLMLTVATVPAQAEIVLGVTYHDGEKYNVEFQQYSRMQPLYRENGIRAAYLESSLLSHSDCTEDNLLQQLKQFQVVHLTTTHEGVKCFDAAHQKEAEVVGRALARYVEGGGGLFLEPVSVRYPNDQDEVYWNAVMAPLGLQILHEGVFDKTRAFEGMTLNKATFWHTRNIQAHPVTKDVSQLYLPLHAYGSFPGLVAMRYDSTWQVLAQGEKEARSYRSNAGIDNDINLNTEGTYASAPPVLAVRRLGKGRIVCYPLSPLFSGQNHLNPMWADIVEVNGDKAAGQPSDSMKMQMNAYKWLAEPSRDLKDYGTYARIPYQPVKFPATVDLDHSKFAVVPASANGIRGIFGAHTSYSDGTGTVADYVKAAKDAGLSFIVFNDPLEKLTAEKLNKLKADCAAASTNDFYACPGIEFTDGIGNRWAMWGEKILFPPATFKQRDREYVQWDGKVVHHFGSFDTDTCQFGHAALLDYKQLRQNGAHPENLWAFFDYLPFVYDKNRLIADNTPDYLSGLRGLYCWVSVESFTRMQSPADVAAAAAACFTGAKDLPQMKAALKANALPGPYVSQGPVIAAWDGISGVGGNWLYTRGAQRARMHFVVRSDAGIAEVKVLDADQGLVRRFLGNGAKELSREFELVCDQQHYLVLEVVDTAGKKAVSGHYFLYFYKGGLFRCGDNCNILGGTAMIWHPDRNQFFNAAKDFRNGADFALQGWDTGSTALGVPQPVCNLDDGINLQETKGWYPKADPEKVIGRVMDMGVNSYNMIISTMRMTKFQENCATASRPGPYQATVPRDVGDLEYCERTHTLYAPTERADMFITWDYRRSFEGRKDYQGGLLWHEGEIRFKKDCTLQGPVPIPLFSDRCPVDLSRNIGTTFLAAGVNGWPEMVMLRDEKQPVCSQGRIRPGGYAALMTTPVGYHGLLVPADMDFAYGANISGGGGMFNAGLGHDGQQIKAGTVFKYRFGVGTFVDNAVGSALLEHTVKAMNLGGGHDGYPVEMKTGELEDAVFFFTARSKQNETAFILGPQKLIIDLPIRIHGLKNNGCAAVYSTMRPWYMFVPVDADGTAWFQEPIDQKNEIWVGNVFVAEDNDIKLTLVVDGQSAGKTPFLEIHNPTDKPVTTKISSPAGAPKFGGTSFEVTVPAGSSVQQKLKTLK